MTIEKLTDNVQPLDLISAVNDLVEEVSNVPTNLSDLVDDTATTPINKATMAIKLGSSDVGDATQPVYLDNGEPTACTYTLAKSVPSDAVFTDTTYNVFTGADGTDAGSMGLVPAPLATDNNKFLKGDGTWAIISGSGGADIDLSNLSATGESHFQSPLGFTPENVANMVTSISSSSTDTQYPSAKLLYDQLALKQNASTAVTHTASTAVGSSSQPVYVNSSGVVTACSNPLPTNINTLGTTGTITLTDNSINKIAPTGNVTFTLPTITDNTIFHQILVQVDLSTVYSLTLGTTYYFDKTALDMSTTGQYNLFYEYDSTQSYWVVGCVAKGSAS